MTRKINHVMFRGLVNKDLRVTYNMTYTNEGQYTNIKKKDNGDFTYHPQFSISISEGFEKDHIFIPNNRYPQFVLLLRKTIKIVSEHMLELFPDTSKSEFDIDQRTLDRFQQEKAMTTGGMTILPDVWINETNECFPALRFETLWGTCKIPFEDCMAIAQMFRSFDPYAFEISLITLLYAMN
jgi:hypothetical protein